MIEIKRKDKTYNIYTKDEFTLPYSYWKEAKEGEYGISDDGYISICIKVGKLGRTTLLTYPYARALVSKKVQLCFEKRFLNKAYDITERTNAERESRRGNTKRFIQAYCIMFLAGKIDWHKLGIIFRPDDGIPEARAKRLIKNKWVKNMIEEELKKELIGRGIDKGFYLDRITEAIEIARSKKDASNMLRAAELIGEILKINTESSKQLYGDVEEVGYKLMGELKDIINIEESKNGQHTDPLQIKD